MRISGKYTLLLLKDVKSISDIKNLKKFLINKGIDAKRDTIIQNELKLPCGYIIGSFEIVNKDRGVYQDHSACSTQFLVIIPFLKGDLASKVSKIKSFS